MPIDSIVSGALQVAELIYRIAQDVKANKAQCQRLAERIRVIMSSVKGLKSVPNADQYKEPLLALSDCLEECKSFMEEFTAAKKWYEKVYIASPAKGRFVELNDQLEKFIAQLNLGLNAQQVMNHEQDKEDQAKDYAFICQNQEEIIRLNQEAHKDLQRLEFKHDQQAEILARQLASLRGHVLKPLAAHEPQNGIPPVLLVPYHELQFDTLLTKGSFGSIYLGRYLHQDIVIKAVEEKLDEAATQEFIREVQITALLRHPHVIAFYGACMEPDRLCMVIEHMAQGSLKDYLTQKRFAPPEQKTVALDIAKGLYYLHHKGVVHGDFKSANILLDSKGRAKITDFGLAKIQDPQIKPIAKRSESIAWLAPEYLKGGTPTSAADVYGFGMILWEIVTGQSPYAEWQKAQKNIRTEVLSGKREIIPEAVPEFYRQIIQACWQPKPSKRPDIQDLVKNLEAYTPQAILSAEELYQKGLIEEQQNQFTEACADYALAAEQGYMKAYTNLGFFNLRGLGGMKPNAPEAYRYFQKAADAGHARGMMNLAALLETGGEGVKQDYPKAMEWYKKAADAGEKKAQTHYARLRELLAPASYAENLASAAAAKPAH